MPREPPVTSATLPASGPSRVVRGMMISSLEFTVPIGTMKVYEAGDAGQGPTTNFSEGDHCALGAHATVRRGRCTGPGTGGVLGARVRGCHAPGADQGHGDQPAKPLRRLREQGGVVPQGAPPLSNGAHVVPDRGPAQADREGCGRGNFLGVRQDAVRPRQSTRLPSRVRGTRMRRGGGDRAPGVGPIEGSDSNSVTGAVREGRAGRRPAGGDRLRDARAVHRDGAERPGSSGGQRGDREGAAAGFGTGDASMAILTNRLVLSSDRWVGAGRLDRDDGGYHAFRLLILRASVRHRNGTSLRRPNLHKWLQVK